MIGQTGFFFAARGLGNDFDSHPEAGWVLAPEAHGRGFGLEAAQAAHDWFDRVIPGSLVTMIDPDNLGSLRLAAHLGYEEFRETEFGGATVVLLSRNGPPGRG
jgi:RimJ/RimL family protein N-acetyltransferase